MEASSAVYDTSVFETIGASQIIDNMVADPQSVGSSRSYTEQVQCGSISSISSKRSHSVSHRV